MLLRADEVIECWFESGRAAPSEMVRDTNDTKGYAVVRKLDVGIRHMLEPDADLVGITLAKSKAGAKELSKLERDAELLFLLQPRMRKKADADPNVGCGPILGPLETRGWRHADSSKALIAPGVRPATSRSITSSSMWPVTRQVFLSIKGELASHTAAMPKIFVCSAYPIDSAMLSAEAIDAAYAARPKAEAKSRRTRWQDVIAILAQD